MKYRSSATAAVADPRNYLNAVFSGPCNHCTEHAAAVAELMNYDLPDLGVANLYPLLYY